MSAPDILVSDAEREAAAERLRLAAGEGRLAQDELEERISHLPRPPALPGPPRL